MTLFVAKEGTTYWNALKGPQSDLSGATPFTMMQTFYSDCLPVGHQWKQLYLELNGITSSKGEYRLVQVDSEVPAWWGVTGWGSLEDSLVIQHQDKNDHPFLPNGVGVAWVPVELANRIQTMLWKGN